MGFRHGEGHRTLNNSTRYRKKALRIINNRSYRSHTDPLFKRDHILKIHDIYKLHCILFIYDYKHGNLPNSFDMFFPRPHNNNMTTRQVHDIIQTRPRTDFSARSPMHALPTLWNNLSPDLKILNNRNQLKRALMNKIIASYDSEVICRDPRCPDCSHHIG